MVWSTCNAHCCSVCCSPSVWSGVRGNSGAMIDTGSGQTPTNVRYAPCNNTPRWGDSTAAGQLPSRAQLQKSPSTQLPVGRQSTSITNCININHQQRGACCLLYMLGQRHSSEHPLSCVHVRRIYTDGLAKDSKQSLISWLVAITTLTLYTGMLAPCTSPAYLPAPPPPPPTSRC